ncbi:hypothetical protein [Streptomyces sp. MJP52]|uniref:hypothetical protein n=1 Tax=Streptomyces sp. MJP52 TaxID=2940555 RepID=UPI0024743B01|nr:hypothetical protein [Streptomyces sp. MJP52]
MSRSTHAIRKPLTHPLGEGLAGAKHGDASPSRRERLRPAVEHFETLRDRGSTTHLHVRTADRTSDAARTPVPLTDPYAD